MEPLSSQSKLAVLIDADNAQPSLAEALLAEIAKYGVATVKRAYGDWTLPNLGGWKKTLAEHAIQPIQQFRNTIGKNASDSALIIDAMDLLYAARLDGFCIVSSDSDFTRLASRIRETGLLVYGFGERKTPQAFVSACDKFVYVDLLRPADTTPDAELAKPVQKPADALTPSASVETTVVKTPTAKPSKSAKKVDPRQDKALHRLLRAALEDAAAEDGWASLSELRNLVGKRVKDFDQRSYGFTKLSELVTALGLFDIEKRGAKGKPKVIYLREKRAKPAPKA